MGSDTQDNNELSAKDILKELKLHGINLHHKTGLPKLQSILKQVHAGTYQVDKVEEKTETVEVVEKVEVALTEPTEAALAAKKAHQTLTREQRALKLSRVVVSPNDPALNQHSGLIFSVGSSKVNKGRVVKKFVPFNNEEGWHVPQIILDTIEQGQYQHFKEVTRPDGSKTMVAHQSKKFTVRYLDALTDAEMKKLAASQQATDGIGQ